MNFLSYDYLPICPIRSMLLSDYLTNIMLLIDAIQINRLKMIFDYMITKALLTYLQRLLISQSIKLN